MTKPKQSEASLKDRKREQNRLSQRCLRERRLLQTRQAASVKEAIQYAATGSDEDKSTQIARLTAQLLEVTEQNRRLSEALLRMRKKFLSIGTASNMAGEDEIFNDLLGKTAGKREMSEVQEDEDAPSDIQDDKHSVVGSILRAERAPAQIDSSYTHISLASAPVDHTKMITSPVDHLQQPPGTNGSDTHEDREVEDIVETSGAIAATHNAYTPQTNITPSAGGANCLNDLEGYYENDIAVYQHGEPWLLDHDTHYRKATDPVHPGYQMFRYNSHAAFGQDGFAAPDAQLPLLGPQLILSTVAQLRFRGCCIFTQSVEETCVSYAVQMSGVKAIENSLCRVPNTSNLGQEFTTITNHQMPEKVLDNLINVAVYLIAVFARVEIFLYCLGADRILEAVLRWRFLPSRENAYAIPSPFCPTPLQAFGPGHHVMIDCCAWPNIRDQLILHNGSYDMDELSADMMQLTVLEIPYLKAAANVLDLLVTDILPEENGSSDASLHGSTSVLNQSATEDFHGTDDPIRPVDQSLLNEIYGRIMSGKPLELTPEKTPPRSRLAPKFGLNNFHNWKLSTDFGKKYPFLDCTLAESKYPTISAATVLDVGLWVLSA